MSNSTPNWEQRWHPLRREWVVVAAHRNARPWSGETQAEAGADAPAHSDDCYLCPGNARVSGLRNPKYAGVYVFDNDHPCVGPDAPHEVARAPGIYRNSSAQGVARVVCYGPEHNLRLCRLPTSRVAALLGCWQEQYLELGAREEVNHVLLFENNGEAVGVSNPHPHSQIYATNFVFRTTEVEIEAERAHLASSGRVLFQDIVASEREDGTRVLCENEHAIAFLPWFARYAYEVYVAPKATHASIADLSAAEIEGLADVLRRVLIRFDNLWQMPFPYVMALHDAPTDGGDYAAHHFHIEIHPPLRRPNLLKYLAGPEIGGGNFIADTWPDDSAAELRACGEEHYRGEAASESGAA